MAKKTKLFENRRRRLRQLIDERYEGNQADFARLVQRAAPQIWSYLNGERNLGEKLARHFEECARLPLGWFDRTDDEDEAAQITIQLSGMSPRDRANIQRLLIALDQDGKINSDRLESAVDFLAPRQLKAPEPSDSD